MRSRLSALARLCRLAASRRRRRYCDVGATLPRLGPPSNGRSLSSPPRHHDVAPALSLATVF